MRHLSLDTFHATEVLRESFCISRMVTSFCFRHTEALWMIGVENLIDEKHPNLLITRKLYQSRMARNRTDFEIRGQSRQKLPKNNMELTKFDLQMNLVQGIQNETGFKFD